MAGSKTKFEIISTILNDTHSLYNMNAIQYLLHYLVKLLEYIILHKRCLNDGWVIKPNFGLMTQLTTLNYKYNSEQYTYILQ